MFDFPQPGEIYRSAGFPDVAVSVDPKYRDAYSTHIPAVILAVNNNPMRFTDRSGGVSRRRVIIYFPEQIAPQERDPQLKDKITRELAVIVRHLMQKFSDPMLARSLLQSQQNSDEALNIKRDADPTFDFIGYLETLPQTSGMYMGRLPDGAQACWQTHERAGAGQLPAADSPV